MPLPSSGSISLGQVNSELEVSATNVISLNQSNVRSLLGLPSGIVGLNAARGKSYRFYFNQTISGNLNNYNLRQAAINAGWDQVKVLSANITINGGVVISSISTSLPAFEVGSAFPTTSSLIVNNFGTINGLGGAGGAGGVNGGNGAAGLSGGLAFRTQFPTTLNNNGVIAGGQGGQGGGAAIRNGGTSGSIGAGCSGGLICFTPNACSVGFCNTNFGANGVSGGSNGVAGTSGSLGSSVSYGSSRVCASTNGCAGLGCNGIVGCLTGVPGAGGAAGLCISGNGNITYQAVGTRLGPIN